MRHAQDHSSDGCCRCGARRLGLATEAEAQETVKIGAVYRLSGNSASAGEYSKKAMELGVEVINNGNADLAKILPLAKGGGLPGLKGAKIQLILADNQGTPAAGQNQTLRLISEEKVAAVIGAYQSGITLTGRTVLQGPAGEMAHNPDVQRIYLGVE